MERGGVFFTENGLADALRALLPARALRALLVTSDPADRERTAHMAAELRATLEKSGYAVSGKRAPCRLSR